MVLALKLCRRPSEWPTSCMTTSLIAWPRNSSGSLAPGRSCRPAAARAMAARLYSCSAHRAELARRRTCPGPCGDAARICKRTPLRGHQFGSSPSCRSCRAARRCAEPGSGNGKSVALLGGQHRADDLADGQNGLGRVDCRPARAGTGVPDQERVFPLPIANPARIEDHVAIDHFAGERIGTEGGHGKGGAGRDPAERAVIDVFRIELIALILPAHRDGVAEADLLESLVPFQDALFHVRPEFLRARCLRPTRRFASWAETAWLLGRTFSRRQRLIIANE